MKRKLFIVLFVQLLVIVAAGFAFWQFSQKQVEPTKVFVFNKDLKVNSAVEIGDFTVVEVPKRAVTKDFLFASEANQMVEEMEGNMFVSRDVKSGEYVYKSDISAEGDVDEFLSMDLSKLRKFSFPINYSTAFGGNISRGDLVDLVFTGDGTAQVEGMSDSNFQYSKVFMQGVKVYNVTTSDGYPFKDHSDFVFKENSIEDQEGMATLNNEPIAVVTLAVTLDQAEELTARMKAGHVRLIGGLGSEESYETLGYVIGDYEKVFTGNVNAETGRANN